MLVCVLILCDRLVTESEGVVNGTSHYSGKSIFPYAKSVLPKERIILLARTRRINGAKNGALNVLT